MLYLPTINKTFYHFPKTGGLYFKQVLIKFKIPFEPIGNQHDTPLRPRKRSELDQSFAFFRSPSSWLWSYWRYKKGGDHPGRFEPWIAFHPCWPVDDLFADDFKTFLDNNIEDDFSGLRKMYYDFSQVGARLNFENLQEEISNVLGLPLNEVIKVKAFNVSQKFEYPELSLYQKWSLREIDTWFTNL